MAKIKKGDIVEVIAGAKQDRGGDRGKRTRARRKHTIFSNGFPCVVRSR